MKYDNDHRVTVPQGTYPGLTDAIVNAGHFWENNGGTWYADDARAVQAIIDAYTPADALADAVAPLLLKVKSLAHAKIIAFLPEWKQSNHNARMNELNLARFERDWTADEQAEVEDLRAVWERAKAIRAASDVHEAALRALTSVAQVIAYDYEHRGWPDDLQPPEQQQ